MSEREAFMRAICDNPDDDTARLVFADWLQENGEEDRAEFIRLQCELATMPNCKQKDEKQVREKELLATYREEWTEPLKEFEGNRTEDYYVFRRGFVEAVGSDGEIMIENGEQLFELAPIREMVFADEEEYEELAKCKWLLRLHSLDLKGSGLSHYFDPNPLIQSPYLANLRELCLAGEDDNGHLDSGGITALAETQYLANLAKLDLSGNWMFAVSSSSPERVACRTALWRLGENKPGLRELRLRATGFGDAELLGLCRQLWVKQLSVLDLSRNNISDAGCHALCDAVNFTNLVAVDLRDNSLWDEETDSAIVISPVAQRRFAERFAKGGKL